VRVGWSQQRSNYWPYEHLATRASAQVRRSLRGAKGCQVDEATQGAIAQTTFLLELIFHLNALADEDQRRAELRCEVLGMQVRALDLEQTLLKDSEVDLGTPLAERKEACRAGFAALVGDLATADEARHLLEVRYLDGRPALFPRIPEGWQTIRDVVRELATLSAEVVGPTDDVQTQPGDALAHAGDLADRVRSMALGLLGDPAGARAVAARRLQARTSSPPKPQPDAREVDRGQDLGPAQ